MTTKAGIGMSYHHNPNIAGREAAEQPVRGAPPVVSRTARTKECWSYPIEPNMKTKSGLLPPAFLSACSAASRPATLGL